MTILQLLEKMAGGAAGLIALLKAAGEQAPDLAPLANDWIAQLSAAASQENLIALATALPKEIAAIASGNIAPKDHPGDAI